MFNTTGNKILIVETVPPFERLEFQFMPTELNWKRSAKLSPIAIVGRNNDKQQFTGGRDTLSFKLTFFSDEENRKDVLRKTNFLRSLAMNDGRSGLVRNVKIVFGSFLRKEVWVVSNVDINYDNFNDQYAFLPVQAEVKIELILDPKKNNRLSDVRS